MRVFIGVKPSATLLPRIEETARLLCDSLGPLREKCRPIAPAQIHLTLHFLGHIKEERLPELKEILSQARRFPKVEQPFDEWLFLPKKELPRMVAVGSTQVEPGLSALQAAVTDQLRAKGFELEERPFLPHLTLVRFRKPISLEMTASFEPISFPIPSLTLFRSHLGETGSRYESLGEFQLAAV